MAHFALLDENDVVIQVVVISNNDCLDENGQESEEVGSAFCQSLFGTTPWIQTSYNSKFRGRFAGLGYWYLREFDVFVPPQPKPWYVLVDNHHWEVPFGIHPDTGKQLSEGELLWISLLSNLPRMDFSKMPEMFEIWDNS